MIAPTSKIGSKSRFVPRSLSAILALGGLAILIAGLRTHFPIGIIVIFGFIIWIGWILRAFNIGNKALWRILWISTFCYHSFTGGLLTLFVLPFLFPLPFFQAVYFWQFVVLSFSVIAFIAEIVPISPPKLPDTAEQDAAANP